LQAIASYGRQSHSMETLLSAKQVQELLHVDRTTIYRMLKDGRLTGVKVGQQWRFYASEINELLTGTALTGEKDAPVSVDVLPLHCLQPMQDVFAEIAEVGAVTTDKEGQPLTRLSNSCDFCKLILGSEEGRQACVESWHKLAQHDGTSPEFIPCHAGLQYASARIEVQGERLALLISGQFYAKSPDSQEQVQRIQKLSSACHIDPNLLSQAAEKIPVLDSRKETQLWEWLKRVARTFEQISSERANLMHRLKQIAVMSDFGS
jgi:excisionase family DNA binding protein